MTWLYTQKYWSSINIVCACDPGSELSRAQQEFPLITVVTGTMKKSITIVFILLFPLQSLAEAPQVLTAVSSDNRVALLELYTSEGCSSCPPADRFMSRVKRADISDQQLIPLSFHVTYWDHIGWKDRFSHPQHDARQRKLAKMNNSSEVYTPQFIMNGKDFRRHGSFDNEIVRINSIAAEYKLELSAELNADAIDVVLDTRRPIDSNDKAAVFIALYEHGLSSEVSDGENKGEQLHHDYVVRDLKGPFLIDQYQSVYKTSFARSDYKIENCGIVAFIQKPKSSEVLQAVRLELGQ